MLGVLNPMMLSGSSRKPLIPRLEAVRVLDADTREKVSMETHTQVRKEGLVSSPAPRARAWPILIHRTTNLVHPNKRGRSSEEASSS